MIKWKRKALIKKRINRLLTVSYICLLMCCGTSALALPAISTGEVYNVHNYGAVGNGIVLDTKSINNAIETAAKNGGGIVYFPSGNYLTGTIHLQSNITLYIANGATIVAADAIKDSAEYDKPEPAINDQYQDFGHSHFHNSLIWGEKLDNVTIEGQGMIYGKGLARSAHQGDYKFDFSANKSIALLLCKNVTIKDITINHGGWFGILATGTDNLTIDNVKMDTNRDGMDIDCCKNVHISNCSINSPRDDGICLKSSFALGYTRTTENVTIVNCQVTGYKEGTFLDGTYQINDLNSSGGGIKLGTESNGGFKNIAISNCVFDHSKGLALETVDGALLEDVTISNITMRNIINSPIFIRLGARMRAPDSMKVGECRRISLNNINIYKAAARSGCIISGIPGHDIKEIQLSNISIVYDGGGTRKMNTREVPEYEDAYPEPYRFGIMPSYGFFIRHVDGLKLNDVNVRFIKEDQRSGFILDSVSNAELNFTTAKTAIGSNSLVIFGGMNIKLFQSFGIGDKLYKKVFKRNIQ